MPKMKKKAARKLLRSLGKRYGMKAGVPRLPPSVRARLDPVVLSELAKLTRSIPEVAEAIEEVVKVIDEVSDHVASDGPMLELLKDIDHKLNQQQKILETLTQHVIAHHTVSADRWEQVTALAESQGLELNAK